MRLRPVTIRGEAVICHCGYSRGEEIPASGKGKRLPSAYRVVANLSSNYLLSRNQNGFQRIEAISQDLRTRREHLQKNRPSYIQHVTSLVDSEAHPSSVCDVALTDRSKSSIPGPRYQLSTQ